MIKFEKKVKSKSKTTYISEDLIMYIEMLAAKFGRTDSKVIAKIIEESKIEYDREQEVKKNGA